MTSETLQTNTPENVQHISDQELRDTLEASQSMMLKITNDPSFHSQLIESGVDPYDDMGKPTYWDGFAEFVTEKVEKIRASNGNSLKLSTLELLASAPSYFYRQQELQQQRSNTNERADRTSLETVSHFNSLIRNFAVAFPDTRASILTTGLLNTVNMSVEGKAPKQAAADNLKNCIRGAQHELAFQQIVSHTGRAIYPSSLEEDLRGIDYAVMGHNRLLNVDVKASLTDINKHGTTNTDAYSIRRGTIVMYSLTNDSEFKDRFFISEEAAVGKAEAMGEQLTKAELDLAA